MVAAAKLNHPNIVTAHDAGEAKGINYLVMEYVEGQDLAAIVKKQGCPDRNVLQLRATKYDSTSIQSSFE